MNPVDQSFLNELESQMKSLVPEIESTTNLKHKSFDVNGTQVTSFHFEDIDMDEEGKVRVGVASQIKESVLDFALDHKKDLLAGAFFALVLLLFIRDIVEFFSYIKWVNPDKYGLWKYFFITVGGISAWLYSTYGTFWNYYRYKFLSLGLVYSAIVQATGSAFSIVTYWMTANGFAGIETGLFMTPEMVILAFRITLLLPWFLTVVFGYRMYVYHMSQEYNVDHIKQFRMSLYLGPGTATPYEYAIGIARFMEDGKLHVIREFDRWLHLKALGGTGTGKTSMSLLKAAAQDNNTRTRNENKLKSELRKMILGRKVLIKQPFHDREFRKELFSPVEGYESEFDDLFSKYRVAGITVVAPEESFPDSVAELLDKHGTDYDRVDPKLLQNGSHKKNFRGINPFKMPPNIESWAVRKEIMQKSTMFADIMEIVNQMNGGSSDPYFTGVNRIGITSLSVLLNVTYPLMYPGKTPNPTTVLELMADFAKVKPYYTELAKYNKSNNNEYKIIEDLIAQNFINGETSKKFFEHSAGLKNLLMNFMSSPLIEAVFQADEVIDFDDALLNGRIILCNFEKGQLGSVASSAFGLFFIMSFVEAVWRRPGTENTRTPQFLYIDELSDILSPKMEAMWSQFRKFRVSVFSAIQTMDQMKKNPFLSYMGGMLLNNVGHWFVFGRATVNDMKTFETLAGTKTVVEEVVSMAHTAISDANPSSRISRSSSVKEKSRTSGSKIRFKQFSEITCFSMQHGTLIDAFEGKMFFLSRKEKRGVRRERVDWAKLIEFQGGIRNSGKQNANTKVAEEPQGADIRSIASVGYTPTIDLSVTSSQNNGTAGVEIVEHTDDHNTQVMDLFRNLGEGKEPPQQKRGKSALPHNGPSLFDLIVKNDETSQQATLRTEAQVRVDIDREKPSVTETDHGGLLDLLADVQKHYNNSGGNSNE